jgi:hypothetical protein
MAAKLTRLTHKIAIQLHLVAESCITCSSHSRRPVRKLLDTLVPHSVLTLHAKLSINVTNVHQHVKKYALVIDIQFTQ